MDVSHGELLDVSQRLTTIGFCSIEGETVNVLHIRHGRREAPSQH
jgi:plasmid stabilization system protein ParE